jgi:hypothetical protein
MHQVVQDFLIGQRLGDGDLIGNVAPDNFDLLAPWGLIQSGRIAGEDSHVVAGRQ